MTDDSPTVTSCTLTTDDELHAAMAMLATVGRTVEVPEALQDAMTTTAPFQFVVASPPPLQPPGTPAALSLYDTSPLRDTLEELIDFDLINKSSDALLTGV